MKTQELRIRNLIKHTNEVLEVECIHPSYGINFIFFEGGWGDYGMVCDDYKLQDLEPIPLTEDWLVRMGFEIKTASVTHNHTFIKGDFIINNPLRGNMTYEHIKLKHVHQLQNLYFALTGEELTFKP